MKFRLILALIAATFSSVHGYAAGSSRDRLLEVTADWIGTPYGVGPLGEGETGRFDQDPLFRFDQFDCVTFVETALSHALATGVQDFERRMNEIRYLNGEVGYTTRNHFSEVDWIPNNIKNGILFPVMKDDVAIAVAKIDKKNWYAKKPITELKVGDVSERKKQRLWKKLKNAGSRMPLEVSKLPYIPFSKFPDVLEGMPPVLVLSVVRPGWDLVAAAGTELNITHQGLLLQIDGNWVVRHATSDSRYQVVEDRLEDFINKRQKTPGVAGLNLMGVNGF